MNPEQLSALFAQHRPVVLGAGAAAVAGLALWQKKKKATGAGAATAAGNVGATGTGVAGSIPAAAVQSQAAGYDSTSFDVYNALQPELEMLRNQQDQQTGGAGSGISAPAPVASSLLSPTYNGHYVRFNDGAVDEVENDGSLYWLSPSEHATAFANAGGHWDASGLVDQLQVASPTAGIYSTGSNLLNAQSKFTTPTAAASS